MKKIIILMSVLLLFSSLEHAMDLQDMDADGFQIVSLEEGPVLPCLLPEYSHEAFLKFTIGLLEGTLAQCEKDYKEWQEFHTNKFSQELKRVTDNANKLSKELTTQTENNRKLIQRVEALEAAVRSRNRTIANQRNELSKFCEKPFITAKKTENKNASIH